MPIFSRRTLQRLLDDLESRAPASKISDHIRRLNTGGSAAISTAWELAVISALATIGTLEIEPDLGTATLVDFRLELGDATWECVGDIVTIFDGGMYDESNLSELEALVWGRVEAHRLKRLRFNLWLVGDVSGEGRHQRVRLPPLKKAQLIAELDPFLRTVKGDPTVLREKDLRRDGHGFIIRYDPRQYSGSWSGTRIDAVYGLSANPLMNALKRKAQQLKNTNYAGPRVIVCCDGGSESLRARRNAIWRSPSTDDIIRDFLRQNRSVTAVLLIVVAGSPIRPVLDARTRSLYRITTAFGAMATSPDIDAVHRVSRDLVAGLPTVVRAPTSIPRPWESAPDYRFFRFSSFKEMTGTTIQIPARALLELLAGRIDHKKFVSVYVSRLVSDPHAADNHFARWLKRGTLLAAARVIREQAHDDDWIEFSCGGIDAAMSPFRVPAKQRGMPTGDSGQS